MARSRFDADVVPAPPYVLETDRLGAEVLRGTEWLLTNGLGGFAMGTASGVRRRKYHGVLNAPAEPPLGRVATIATLDESVLLGAGTPNEELLPLAPRETPTLPDCRSDVMETVGSFEKTEDAAVWTLRFPGGTVRKELRLGWLRNVASVRYTVETDRPVRFVLRPRPLVRDMHAVHESDPADRVRVERREDGFDAWEAGSGWLVRVRARGLSVRAASPDGGDEPADARYDLEAARGQPAVERLHVAAVLEAWADRDRPIDAVVSVALDPEEPDLDLFGEVGAGRGAGASARVAQLDAVMEGAGPRLAPLRPLVSAASDFLVRRTVGGRELLTVLAGYPWFGDWGRDTMISLPGLLLATGRFGDALACLETFAAYESEGMIPNLFDENSRPHYNTVDASLWFLHACRGYGDASGDWEGFGEKLLPACAAVIAAYESGTRFGIRADPADGLITAGDETTQLTWMDAKRDGVVFSPRHGKAVEINALWIHGLRGVAGAVGPSNEALAARCEALAQRAAESFLRVFDDPGTGGLHDCVRPDGSGAERPTGEFRANQIFAASLERSPLDAAGRGRVVAAVRERLLTPRGLRTLAPGEGRYASRFEGDMTSRDGAYHNGTVWPWLIGAYAEAVLRSDDFSASAREEAASALAPLLATLGPNADPAAGASSAGCLGQIAEVYDAEDPRRPEGCVAQAWSVAEVLRVAAMLA